MARLVAVAVVLLSAHCRARPEAIGEFKRMPDLRGQSFGLENFLMQPFNLASQADSSHSAPQRKRNQPHSDSFSVEFEVNNEDFDMRRLVPTLPGADMVYSQSEDLKPVHEHIEEAPPPPQRKHNERRRRPPVYDEGLDSQTERPHKVKAPTENHEEFLPKPPPRKLPSLEDEIQALVLDGQTERSFPRKPPNVNDDIQSLIARPEIRRPLEKPAEFMVSIAQHTDEYPSILDELKPERSRKRVMKRRRKRPSTPGPQLDEEDENVKEVEDNSFISLPTSYQQTVKDTTGAESIVIEHGQGSRRRPPPGFKQRDDKPSRYEEKLTEPTPSESEIIQSTKEFPVAANVANVASTNSPGPAESTQKLKSLLKQQNGQLSLSELLQTQHLSLSDFLKGNPGALSALGGNKVTTEKQESPPVVEQEKPRERPIPKISLKSRPFSKPSNGTIKPPAPRRSTTTTPPVTEESTPELPKKLDIIEVTSDKPTYNGFAPKRPRVRLGPKAHPKFNYSREKIEETTTQKTTTSTTTEKPEEVVEDDEDEEEISENDLKALQSVTKAPPAKSTTQPPPLESSTVDTKPTPTSKRYGEHRPKFKIDRRKPSAESTTEGTTLPDKVQETTLSVTTEEAKSTRSRDRVRIPFQSANNPEVSVIIPNKKTSTTTEKPRPSPVIKDRINVFKRINSEEKITENTIESHEKGPQTPQGPTTSTTPHERVENDDEEENEEKEEEEEDGGEDVTGKETSDEILELLKAGKQAVRLQRILSARNMTVNELVEKRANASRQPNVTKLFERRTSSSESIRGKQKFTLENHQLSTTTERPSAPLTTKRIIPVFDILSPNYKTDAGDKMRVRSEVVKPQETNSFDELFVDESVVRPIKLPIDETREAKSYDKDLKPGRIQLNLSPGVDGKAQPPVPLWNVDEKSIYSISPYGYPTYDMNNNLIGRTTTTTESSKIQEQDTLIFETIKVDDGNNRLKSSINDILKERVEVVKDVREEVPVIPPAVKSAIIASGVVMGIALVVFVAIFATCGWKQRQFRLRARSSILNDSIDGSRKAIRRSGTLSPVSFKRSALYKKSIDFDTESSASGSSNTSSYLWNTLKHTFQSRNSTLKNRQEKEEKIQDRENRSRRNTLCREEERPRNNIIREDDRLRNSTSRDDDRPRNSTMSREDPRCRDVDVQQMPRRNTLTREDIRRDSLMSRDTLTSSRDLVRTESRRSSCMRDREDGRGIKSVGGVARDNERCSFRTIDPDRHIIQTSVNFKRGGRDHFDSSRHFDNFDGCDHFN